MKKIMGLDEAGRGPVLGALFMGGVVYTEDNLKILEESDVNDSKKLSPKKRRKLREFIQNTCHSFSVKKIPVEKIDNNIKHIKSLNALEMELMVDLINTLQPDEVFIDAIGSNPEKFAQDIENLLKKTNSHIPSKIIAKNKGDSEFKIVGAASILAKVERDAALEELKEDYQEFGDIGSGYTSDQKTITFLKNYVIKYKKIPPIARRSWKTSERIYNEIVGQSKLTDFGPK